jgi:hypothetical protein
MVTDCDNQNTKIFLRNIPSQPLQPYYDPRPVVSNKPTMEYRKEDIPIQQYPTYNPRDVFSPGNDTAPWSGFASNINLESELRNINYSMQKGTQSYYVPGSNSDLYVPTVNPMNDIPQEQKEDENSPYHPLLFSQEKFCPFNPTPNQDSLGYMSFYNSTRDHVRAMNPY